MSHDRSPHLSGGHLQQSFYFSLKNGKLQFHGRIIVCPSAREKLVVHRDLRSEPGNDQEKKKTTTEELLFGTEQARLFGVYGCWRL